MFDIHDLRVGRGGVAPRSPELEELVLRQGLPSLEGLLIPD